MNQVIRKSISYLMIITLIFTAFASLQVVNNEVEAASYPTTHPNTYKNTGNYINDIIGVARTQIGYKENSAGTKYGYWYSPSFVNQPWCAMFVSWCADQAKVPQSAIKKYASCSIEVSWFKSEGRWHDSEYYGGKYTPQKGDVVFYRDSGSSAVSTHTGILVGLNGNYLDVIEGNATNESVTHYTTNSSRTLTNKYVIGYGNPKYGQAAEPENEPDTYENWQVNADALTLRAKTSTSSSKLTTIPLGTRIEVTEFAQEGGYLWGYTTYKGKAGWCALDYCDYINGNIDGEYYQLPPKVSPTKATIYIDKTKKLSVVNGLGVTYSSTDSEIAKVNKNGKITALKKGTAKIKCKTNTGTATCKVTVEEPHIDQTSVISCIGDSVTLSVVGASGEVKWSSSDKKIATVSSSGKVKGVSKGTVTITATVGSLSLKSTVKIYTYPKTYENFTTKKKIDLKDNYTGTKKNLLSIPKSTDLKITKVEYTNTLTYGKTKYSGKTGWVVLNNCKYKNGSFNGVTYKAKPYLKSTSKTIYLKGKYTLELKSASGTVTYKSKDKTIAKISKDGVVTALKEGETKVYATVGETVLKCKIKVSNPILSKASLNILKGKTKKLTVTGGNGKISWKSKNKNIATVNSSGVITAKKYGKTTITATRNDIKMECVVKVFNPQLSEKKLTLKAGESKTLTVSKSTGATPKWSTSDKSIAKVSKGKITALKAGKATITAKVNGATLTCVVTVK
ncbi:MAG: Ig-like domain-containing protein [Ruminococcus sp.]|nr:Ig-like domain-containing protein [Ruminococcus sp.]